MASRSSSGGPAPGSAPERLGLGEAVALAPGGLRRRRAQEVVVEQPRQQRARPRGRAARARRPRPCARAPRWRARTTPSISALAGPTSKATTRSGRRPRGSQVTFAMPPRFSTRRDSVGIAERRQVEERRQRRALAARGEVARAEVRDGGGAGALRDAARDRRSGATRAARGGARRSARARRSRRPRRARTPASAATAIAASAKRSPSARRARRARAAPRPAGVRPAASAWMRCWSSGGKRILAVREQAEGARRRRVGHSTSAASTPSAEVPDMSPITRTARPARAAASTPRERLG